MSRARRSASPCRACATIRAAWRRSASTSPRIASRPTPSRASSPRPAACCWSGKMRRSRRARSAFRPRSTCWSSRSSAACAARSGRSSARLIYVLLRTFSPDMLDVVRVSAERFKLLIGLGFLAIVLFSPDGVLGLWERWRASVAARKAAAATRRRDMNAPVAPSRMIPRGPGGTSAGDNALELRGVTKLFGALAAMSDVTLSREARASGAPCSARTARARPRCSTASPGISCRPPASIRLFRRGRDCVSGPRAHPPRLAPHLPDLLALRRACGDRQRLSRLPRRLAQAVLAAAARARTMR